MGTETDRDSDWIVWARSEIDRAGLFDPGSDYDGMIGEAVMDLCKTFDQAGHSGFSAMWTADVFERLSRWEPLTPITDDPDEWMVIEEEKLAPGEPTLWQSRRSPGCFSHDGGKTFYDINEELSLPRTLLLRYGKRYRPKMHKAETTRSEP
jgi:hypothetical protein